jgi:large subunit ribosomal protein L4
MAVLPVYNLAGKEIRSITLDDRVFALPKNDTLLHEVYVSLSANERGVFAHTKGRGERAGSGKKPWKQKHTGRARAGSVRSPLWRKGGVVFGPKSDRNFSKKINQKARRKAMMLALSEKVRNKTIRVVESFVLPEWKTTVVARSLRALDMSGKSTLLAFTPGESGIGRASRNIPGVSPISAHTVNAKELLDCRFFLVSEASIGDIEKRCLHEIPSTKTV